MMNFVFLLTSMLLAQQLDRAFPIDCPIVEYIPEGYVTGEKCCEPGDKIGFLCDDDITHVLVGASEVTCLNNGSWDQPLPECKSRSCVPPRIPLNGDVEYVQDGDIYYEECCEHGVEAHFTCEEGYDLVGESTTTCHNREWSAPRPLCKPKGIEVCEEIVVPNAVLMEEKAQGDYFVAGDRVLVSCEPGYRMNGTEYLECNKNGTWSHPVPSCDEYNCTRTDMHIGPNVIVEAFANANITEFPVGSSVEVKCPENYMLSGASSLICKDGGWYGKAQCRKIHCGRPSVPEFGWMNMDNWYIGGMSSFGCQQKFKLVGSETRICMANGVWSGTVARCVPEVRRTNEIVCESPGIPDNGMKRGNRYERGARVTFVCNPGYQLRGEDTIVCDRKGHWSGPLPTCIGKFYYDAPWTVRNNLMKPLEDIKNMSDALNAPSEIKERALILNLAGVRHVVYFMLDASNSVGKRHFMNSVSLVKSVIRKINVTPRGHRVGVVTFSNDVTKVVEPHIHVTMDDVLHNLNNINYTGGGTALTSALTDVRMNYDGVSARFKGQYKDLRLKLSIFLITDGRSNIGGSPRQIITQLKEQRYKAEVYAIGITNNPDKEALTELVSKPVNEHLFILRDYDSLMWLADKLTNSTIDYSVCGSTLRHNIETGKEDKDDEEAGTKVRSRIAKGEVVEAPWPWMAEVKNGNSLCGGSIISRKWILTAAHCVCNTGTENVLDNKAISIRLGLTDTRNLATVQNVTVKRIVVHGKYNGTTLENDIALLELEKNTTYGPFVRPICLPPEPDMNKNDFYRSGKQAFVIGWGEDEWQARTETLRQVMLTIVSNENCSDAYRDDKKHNVTAYMMCANGFGKGDACQGDSGGPLMQGVAKDEYIWTQVGIVSWGDDCNKPDKPGVYTNVAKYRTWIDTYVPDGQQGP